MKFEQRNIESFGYPKRWPATMVFFVVLVCLVLGSRPAHGEAGAVSWIANLGSIGFNATGAAFLPPQVLGSIRSGQVSPVMLFVTVNHLANSCIRNVLKKPYVPLERDPYLVAKKKWDGGYCMLTKCFNQGLLVQALPLLSQGGGSASAGPLMAQAFAQDPACNGGQGSGIDPTLLGMFGGGNTTR